ncbi:MAG TPA: mitochondrial fission ELM1 family protein [Rhizomicrobium sp.]|nr:mitochondrial fission ELM1 family protein [Rhizomicrobium sp.]
MTAFSSCWIVTDGKSGMESQCLGLAEALGIDPTVKRVALRNPWRDLAPHLRIGLDHAFVDNTLAPPWPELLIATGRQSVPASLYVRQKSPRTRRVQIQNPGISPRHFDLVITPMHDNLWGANVIQTIGALHRVIPEKLNADARLLEPRVAGLPRPFIGVLIGGANAVYRFGADEARALATEIARHAKSSGGSVLVTPSRRTGDANIAELRTALVSTPGFVWDGSGANPYYGILALADAILVTGDSVNMVSEACASGHPVYIYDLPGGSAKFRRFQQGLVLRGYARRYDGSLEITPMNRLYEMTRVARAVMQLAQ